MISEVLGDAAEVYRRLWPRSVAIAGSIFVVVSLADALARRHPTTGTELVSLVLRLVGGLLVQGALVEIVRDLHEGRAPASLADYYRRTRGELGTLLGATVLAAVGITVGFVFLLVPGLILLARWSLIVPAVMLERRSVGEAFGRSNRLVAGRTGRVLVIAVVAGLLSALAALVVTVAFTFLPVFWATWIGGTLAGAVAVPYQAHVLTVLYYRLSEPERPVLPDRARPGGWRSVWDEEPPA
jgi:hypothetical protein